MEDILVALSSHLWIHLFQLPSPASKHKAEQLNNIVITNALTLLIN